MSTSLFIDPVIQYNTASANTSINESNPIRIFVETASKAIHVLLPETIRQARYSVLSMEGKTLQNGTVHSGQNIITATTATSGIYLVQISYGNECFTQKILF